MKYALAIDIGASSGRHIVGWMDDAGINTKEVYRFPNGMTEENGHLVWDTDSILKHVKAGISKALEEFPEISSLSIDTWGVDYVLMDHEKEILPAYAYRDSRTEDAVKKVHAIMPFSELYSRTGCQFQPFNTVYQLYADKTESRLDKATDFLMMPEYLMYRLCGTKSKEFTNATTTGLINAETLGFDTKIIQKLGLPERLFPELKQPGETIGTYEGIPVMLCATHDTASAVEGIPMDRDGIYISSGTWSLLGIKTKRPVTSESSEKANYSNEGGIGYNRYQKNIMGMWLVNELKRELCPDKDFDDIVREAEDSSYERTVDANDPAFLAPSSMKQAFDDVLNERISEADYFRCAFRSLAICYGNAVRELEYNTGKSPDDLYIVGGGAKNTFLNRLTEEATGKRVTAMPIEATAYGNLKIQLEAINEL